MPSRISSLEAGNSLLRSQAKHNESVATITDTAETAQQIIRVDSITVGKAIAVSRAVPEIPRRVKPIGPKTEPDDLIRLHFLLRRPQSFLDMKRASYSPGCTILKC